MKKHFLAFVLFALACCPARAGIILTTSDPPGTPLIASPGTISGPMLASVVSDSSPNDVMSAWQVSLVIVADPGTAGTLTFQEPATGTPSPPPGYIFGADGLGISATNAGAQLTANDFFDPAAGPGATVPGPPGANLLELTFLVSADASGLFGIYALEGIANTQWTNGAGSDQLFNNVLDGTSMVRIGEVLIPQSVPSLLRWSCSGSPPLPWPSGTS
jgi:hypothetical protein